MKLFKLIAHQKNFSEDEIILSSKDFPNIKVGDVIEIYHPQDEGCRLLLQVLNLKDEMQTKDTISVEQSIVSMFQLQIYSSVCVNPVDPESVALDSLELTFKDQYLGRSDMWRLKRSLIKSCVYTNKKVEFCHKSVRCQVYEMWSRGEKVSCGVVTDDTKIVFRSLTSQVYLFLQMSSEMLDFDIYGDLYFEKAVNGFLSELFAKWKRQGSNHEVTIVLFSRVFYEADSLDAFPESMRGCLQQDYRGKFYEDFYRSAVQSERLDDWACVLPQLKKLFQNWQTSVLAYHQIDHPGVDIPKGVNSCAAQGNFLEVLNMSLNVFEKHYLDRSFDRTGQLSVVITPGVGVFEVDRELTNITKQRIIDNGVGSDLVCVGEQPLHAVPLLQFHNKRKGAASNDFSMPHWINLSFYSSSKRIGYSTFLPRIKMAPVLNKVLNPVRVSGVLPPKPSSSIKEDGTLPNSVFDYDAYDAKVFSIPLTRTNKVQTLMRETRNRKSGFSTELSRYEQRQARQRKSRHTETEVVPIVNPGDGLSSSLISAPTLLSSSISKSASVCIPKRSVDDSALLLSGATVLHPRVRRPSGGDELYDDRKYNPYRVVVGSAGSPGNRHSTHAAFPLEKMSRPVKTGRALINPFDPSHVTIKLTSNRRRWTHIFPKGPTGVLIQQHHFQAVPSHDNGNVVGRERLNAGVGGKETRNGTAMNRTSTLLWGATGEQEWTPALTTGVDWKSLTIPACLPITTDYFPDQRSLQNDFVVSDYSIIPDDVNTDYGQQRACGRRPLETRQVFLELISQRLAQGFQLIILPKKSMSSDDEYLLSIGRIFHKIVLKGSTITVTGYRPRHPYPTLNIHYRYRLQTPDHDTYEVSWVDFNAEKLENYNWNHLDHYICTRGDRDFALTESLKYWRLRLCVLPTVPRDTQLTEKVLRYLETCVNRFRRLNMPKKMRPPSGSISFRDRGGSNRVTDRPRLRSSVAEMKHLHHIVGDPGIVMEHQPCIEEQAVRLASGLASVVEVMKSPQRGINFLLKYNNLPPLTFISSEAVIWVVEHVDGVSNDKEAIDLLQKMIDERIICHSSGDTRIKFNHGSYLYTFASDAFTPGVVDENFECEWAEVAVDNSFKENETTAVKSRVERLRYSFLDNELETIHHLAKQCEKRYAQMLAYKTCNLEMDISGKSDRLEWGHLRYQNVFYPDASLELIFQWVVCTGPLVAELVQNWSRKAQNCGINLVPMLCDPFALPMSHKADPLRAPIFIPLNLAALSTDGHTFLEQYPADTWPQRLLLFQESIVRQFNFIPCSPDPASPSVSAMLSSGSASRSISPQLQFIHISGTVLVLILNSSGQAQDAVPPSPQRIHRTSTSNWSSNSALVNSAGTGPDPLTSYITRHVVGRQKWQQKQEVRLGFLWAWNSMLSKRWKNPACSDEGVAIKLLSEFRMFCANDKDRLKQFVARGQFHQMKATDPE